MVSAGVIVPGGQLDHLQTLAGYPREDEERVVQGKGSAKKDWEKAWRSELDRLIDSGKTLDQPTNDPDFWREVAGSAGPFKMPEGDVWVERHLKIRTKLGQVELMQLNPAQLRYSHDCAETKAKRNIVLKARQVGITSYVAARYFVQTIMRPGTLTMLVAHDREAAEEIFRIVHRFWDNLAEKSQKGPLKTSHSSARELVFPRLDSEFTVASADENAGRGRTIQNLHCTEVSRWGRDGEEALASLRAAVVPGGEIVLESTANGAWGSFYQEWQQAEETGYTRHFFPWWFEASYKSETGPLFEMTEEEAALAIGARADGGADCVAAAAEGGVARTGGTGVRGRCGDMLPDVGRVRVRTGRDRQGTGGDAGTAEDAVQRGAEHLAASAAGKALCDRSGSGGWGRGWGFLVRAGDRKKVGNTVRRVARAFCAEGAVQQTGAS